MKVSSAAVPVPSARRKGWLILGFCSLYIAAQLFLIVRAHYVPSKHFGFWMFPESTYFTASLGRVLKNGEKVRTTKGSWTVETESGIVSYKWTSFVNGYRMDQLEVRQRSKGTFDDTVRYFKAALNHVAQRIPEDKETQQLVLRIQYRRAGGPEATMMLKSTPRFGGRRDGAS